MNKMSNLEEIIQKITTNSIPALNLNGNWIATSGLKSVADALKINQSISSLNLGCNKIGSDGAKDIAEALKINKSIKTLFLHNNKIEAAGTEYIAKALKMNDVITILDLDRNMIENEGAKHIAEALKVNRSVANLRLQFNQIGDAGVKDIAEALKINNSIKFLNLDDNQIGDDGAKDIAEALMRNQCITELALRNNRVTTAGAEYMAEALKVNKSLILLSLDGNKIENAGIKRLAEALKINKNVTTLIFNYNQMDPTLAKDILESLQNNKDLAKKRQEKTKALEAAKLKTLEEAKIDEYIPNLPVGNIFEAVDETNEFDSVDQTTFKEISDLIRDGNDRLRAYGSKGILLLGNTRAGKSTLAYLLSGRKLQATMDDDTGDLVIEAMQPIEGIIIDHKLASQARIPNKCLVNDLTIWDCPAFNDSNPVQEIANAFYIKRLVEIVEELKFALVVPELILNSANVRGSIFIDTLSSLLSCLSDVESIKGSISLIVTHVAPNKSVHHITKSIDRIMEINQRVTDEHRSLIDKLKTDGSIYLFYKPSEEGDLCVPDLLEEINGHSTYSAVDGDMVNIAISNKATDFSLHLLNTASNNFNRFVEVIVKAICNATQCSTSNPLNAFSENFALVEDWIPKPIDYKLLPIHDKNEYFVELDLLHKLQKVLNCEQIDSIADAIIIFQKAVEVFAEFAEPDSDNLQQKILGYAYCLPQQYEYVKFFAGVCSVLLPGHEKIAELITKCYAKVTDNIEYQVKSLVLDKTRSNQDYYSKAITYMESYSDSPVCRKNIAIANSCMAGIAERNGDQEALFIFCARAIDANSQLPNIYEKLCQYFLNKEDYARAIDCYKVLNNELKIQACFKTWIKHDPENPTIRLKQAKHFESVGLFEKAKNCYHHAFSLSQEDHFKSLTWKKIGSIMIDASARGQDFINRAEQYDFYNFAMVNQDFIKNLIGVQHLKSTIVCNDNSVLE